MMQGVGVCYAAWCDEAKLKITAEAAEIGALRLLDAAETARESIKPTRR